MNLDVYEAQAPRAPSLRRCDVYGQRPVIDGQVGRDGPLRRARAGVTRLLTSRGERHEAQLEHALRRQASVTRPNVIAVASPKGGVGKTTLSVAVGDLLSTSPKLRALVLDANPDFGTLGELAPDRDRTERTQADLLEDLDHVESAAQLSTYVSRLPSGLHLLAAPQRPEHMDRMTPDRYGELLCFVERFYDVVLLDLGTGITDPLARFALQRADQVIVVTTPDWICAGKVLGALHYLRGQRRRLTLAVNQTPSGRAQPHHAAITAAFAQERIPTAGAVPYDERLSIMLDTGTYTLQALPRTTRLPIKQLGLAAARLLV